MVHSPKTIVLEIVGVEEGSCGRLCEEHDVCGCVVDEDIVVCLRKMQVLIVKESEKSLDKLPFWLDHSENEC